MRYYLISLGCPKNAVDAEGMGTLLRTAGHQPVFTPEEADVLLVNTCGFIEPARAESVQVLNELAAEKRSGQRLLALGCYAQRDCAGLAQQVPGLDGILGTRRWAEILSVVEQLERTRTRGPLTKIGDPALGVRETVPRVAIQGSSAYLKIADGCSAACAYCAIPLIKGPLHSRSAQDVLADARHLAQRGVQEILLIAQDTTAYGRDRGERDALPALLQALTEAVPEVPWIRLMYAYPQHITPRLIETMARQPQICHYLDLPLQHAHPDTLRRMCRSDDVKSVRQLIADLREAMPDISLRTSFIVGYPGETETEFHALEQFVREVQFDKVGVFTYSPEEGTPAYDLPDPVPVAVQEERLDRLMAQQQAISLARNQDQVGRVLDVLVEGQGEAEYEDEGPEGDVVPISVGRSYRDAPEIDGLVLIEDVVEVGRIVPVEITGAIEYDLVGILA
jgi:ribosomal protein S12 methylthiotransferase